MEQSLIKPQALRVGDTIGIAAPASPFNQQTFEQGVAVLESMGFRVKIPKSIFKTKGYFAGSETERAKLLMELFEDDSVSAIFCARGGFGSMKLLPLLDFDTITTHPKILVGFSDITALLAAIYKQCGMVTFHGPVVTTLANGSKKTPSALMDALTSTRPLVLTPSKPAVVKPGQASGPMIGGNLTTLTHLMGTPYESELNDHLLFLEDRGEAPYRLDRMLSQLQLGGRLDRVAGVILGTFQDCGSLEDVHDVMKKAFYNAQVPILAGFDVGHGKDNLTVPIGLDADMDTQDGTLRFLEPAVVEVSA